MLFRLHVAPECLDDPDRFGSTLLQRPPEVEEVAAFPPLVEGTQLRRKEFIEVVGRDLRAAAPPATGHLECTLPMAVDGEVLSRVDLDFDPLRLNRLDLRGEPVVERDSALSLLPLRASEPVIKSAANGSHDGADRACLDLHEIDVFGVACGRCEKELVQRGTASKGDLMPKRFL